MPGMNVRRGACSAVKPRRVSADRVRQAPRIVEKRREHEQPDEQTNADRCGEVKKIQWGRSDWHPGGVQIPIPDMIQCQSDAGSSEGDYEGLFGGPHEADGCPG